MTSTEDPAVTVLAEAGGIPSLATEPARVLRLAMRVGADMLASGAQTDDVETAIVTVTTSLGTRGVQAAVTFATIQVSYDAASDAQPTTLLHIVHERNVDFDQLAAMSTLVHGIRNGELGLDTAEQEVGRIETGRPAYPRVATFVAPALSAAGSTLMFGGGVLDAVTTLAIALLVQPALSRIDQSALPPFFRTIFGVTASTLIVVVLVAVGLPVNGGLVLTGSLLRFLPGYALVSGFRDLIGQSVISGTARLAEALLLGAAVAAGAALGLRIGVGVDVYLSIVAAGPVAWGPLVTAAAALLAVGAYAVRLGVPRLAVVQAAVIGAVGWVAFDAATSSGRLDSSIATVASAVFIGATGRILARRSGAPAALWVVPAILPLLPGLQIVQAMLAVTDTARIAGLLGAAATAFFIGVGVATGDIVVSTIRRIRDRIVAPAVDAISVLVVTPVGKAVTALTERADRPSGEALGAERPDPERRHGDRRSSDGPTREG